MNNYTQECLIELINAENSFFKGTNLINNFNLIEKIKANNSNFLKIFYFNAQMIHKLLYKLQEIVELDNRLKSENLSFYYYLVSLIKMDPYTINYTYDFEFIEKIVNLDFAFQKKDENNKSRLRQIIKAKIILDLIDNFKGFYEGNLNEVLRLERENESIIANNISYLKKISSNMEEEFIKYSRLDEIYTTIIISLIKEDKLADSMDIVNQMDFQNIDMNEFMFINLKDVLNSNEKYINKYEIKSMKDLYSPNIINFHYILLKMIIKNCIYIYQISFLFKVRHNIINLLHDDKNNFNFNENNEEIQKLEYVLKIYVDSKYYFTSFNANDEEEEQIKNSQMNNIKNRNANLVIFNKNIPGVTTSKTRTNAIGNHTNFKKIDKIEETDKDSIDNNYNSEQNIFQKKALKNSVFLLYTKEKEKTFIYDEITLGKNNINIKEEFLNELEIFSSEGKGKDQNGQILMTFLLNFEAKIKKKFKLNYCLNLKLIFKREEKDFTNSISCQIFFYDPLTKEEKHFKDENILDHLENFDSSEYEKLFESINNESYLNEKYIAPITIIKEAKKKKEKMNSIKEDYESFIEEQKNFDEEDLKTEATKEEVIAFIKKISLEKKAYEYIREMSNQYFYIYNDKTIVFTDKSYKKILTISLDEKIFNISEKKSNKKNHIELIACCSKNINLIDISMKDFQYHIQQYQIPSVTCLFCYQMLNNIYIILGYSMLVIYHNLFDGTHPNESITLSNKLFFSGIKISNTEIALTSNSLLKKGENNLVIINVVENEVVTNVSGFSYVYGSSGLGVMNINDDIIIIAACKKYVSGQKNGILLIDYKPNENVKNNHTFYETGNFEVHCVCPIVDRKNKINNCFLVGGFDSDIGEGQILLFRVIKDKNKNIEEGYSSIEFLQNIEFEFNSKNQGFDMPVTNIIQSSADDKLLVTNLNNSVNLLTKPNLEYYVNE